MGRPRGHVRGVQSRQETREHLPPGGFTRDRVRVLRRVHAQQRDRGGRRAGGAAGEGVRDSDDGAPGDHADVENITAAVRLDLQDRGAAAPGRGVASGAAREGRVGRAPAPDEPVPAEPGRRVGDAPARERRQGFVQLSPVGVRREPTGAGFRHEASRLGGEGVQENEHPLRRQVVREGSRVSAVKPCNSRQRRIVLPYRLSYVN